MAQWPSLRVISHNMAAFGENCIKFAVARPHWQQWKCRPGSLVSGNTWFTGTKHNLCGSCISCI